MMIKLAIIGAVILGGVIIFANESNQLLPEFSTNTFDSAKTDLKKITDDTIQTTETTIGSGVKTVSDGINDFASNTAEQLSEGVKDLRESTLQVISFGGILGDSQETNSESTERHAKASSSKDTISSSKETNPTPISDSSPTTSSEETNPTPISDSSPTTSSEETNPTPISDSSPATNVTETQTIQTFETSSLTTSQQTFEILSLITSQQSDDTVMLNYEDTSGKTISVTVILRTTEKDLFTGTFYSSMFEASVNDATKTSYFIDVIIEHEDYGTISSSVFNPVDTPDTIIYGVFSQS